MRFVKAAFVLVILCSFAGGAFAQEAEDTSLEHRLELAEKMHSFRSSREQVDSAINTVAARLQPDEQEVFTAAMRNILNYKALEKISVDAMAETFTEKELEAMVEYYSKPEARSISDKYPEYQSKVSPEIVKMIDKAMMRVRTGGTAP